MSHGFPRVPCLPTAVVRCSVLTLLLGLLAPSRGAAATQKPTPDLSAGHAAYGQYCARCHGPEGRGDGLDAKRFYPRPRDLAMGVYKFRSTVSGTPPTDEDLFRTITQGLPGSNMPDWQQVDEATRWQVVYYLKSLSPVFQKATPEPVKVTPDPGPAHADLAKGKVLYTQLGCVACHGPQGRANGPSAAGLVDDWGKKIRPANLTKGWNYRGESDPSAVMLRVLTGIDGAGMPSYAGAVSPEDTWHLAYYVAALQETPHWNRIAHAAYVRGELPRTWNDPRWETAERTDLRVRNVVNSDGEWVDPPTVSSVAVQAISNDTTVAFRLTWDDPSQESPDAFALLLKPAATRGDVVTLQAWPYGDGPALDFCYWSLAVGGAYEMVSTDFEHVITRQGPHPSLASAATYEDGRWHLVLQRPLAPSEPAEAARLAPGEVTSVALSVWDGGMPGVRAVSPWIDVVLRKDASSR